MFVVKMWIVYCFFVLFILVLNFNPLFWIQNLWIDGIEQLFKIYPILQINNCHKTISWIKYSKILKISALMPQHLFLNFLIISVQCIRSKMCFMFQFYEEWWNEHSDIIGIPLKIHWYKILYWYQKLVTHLWRREPNFTCIINPCLH